MFGPADPGVTLAPRSVVVTPDGSRAYVLLNGASSIAVIDAVGLQQVDVDQETFGMQLIDLPDGARPIAGLV